MINSVTRRLAKYMRWFMGLAALMTISACSDPVTNLEKTVRSPEGEGPDSFLTSVNGVRRHNKGKAAAERIQVLLADPDPGVRSRAARALGRIGVEARLVLADLVECLRAPEAE